MENSEHYQSMMNMRAGLLGRVECATHVRNLATALKNYEDNPDRGIKDNALIQASNILYLMLVNIRNYREEGSRLLSLENDIDLRMIFSEFLRDYNTILEKIEYEEVTSRVKKKKFKI